MAKITFVYPPQQTGEWECKPEGALAYPNLGAVLLEKGHEVKIFDACVGNEKDSLDHFYKPKKMYNGLNRIGVQESRILDEISDSNIVGITSIFTAQESMALETCRLIKNYFPDKLLITGGTNARSRYNIFLDAGFDVVCLSEAENTLRQLCCNSSFYDVSGIAFKNASQRIVINPVKNEDIIFDLDELPIPVWELHPNEKYWRIGRPHGVDQNTGKDFKYASMMTSLGCVFKCKYCHISGEHEGSLTGNISAFRVKSKERVIVEFEKLRSLGVEELFLEDDTLFGHKRRGIAILKAVKDFGFRLWDINGINIAHLLRYDRGLRCFMPDEEVLDVLQECDFKQISLPIESGNQRIIDYYASSKWNIAKSNIVFLIQELLKRGIKSGCNYMIGYPDETLEEIETTVDMARIHMQAGAESANFMLVIPLPGTKLYDEAIEKGYLDKTFNPDMFNWRQYVMKNTVVSGEEVVEIHQRVYEELNV